MVLSIIKKDPYASYKEIASILNISIKSVGRLSLELKKRGILLSSKINQYGKRTINEDKINNYENKNASSHEQTPKRHYEGATGHPNNKSIMIKEKKEELVVDIIRNNPYISYEEIATKLNVSITTVRRIFNNLKRKGVLLNRKNQHDKWILVND